MDDIIGLAGPILTSAFQQYLTPSPGPLPPGLGGTPVNALAQELLARGRRLVIFTLDPSVEHEMVLQGDQLTICIGPYRRKRARDFFRQEQAYLTAAMRRERPAFVHAHWTYEFALAAQTSGLPTLVTAHDAPWRVLSLDFRPYRLARTLMAWHAVRRTRHLVAVSPYIAEHLSRWMGFCGSAEVLPNGLAEECFTSAPARTEGPLTFATCANGFNALKNTATALEAFALVRRQVPDAQLLMFGGEHGPGEAAARWAEAYGLSAGVRFMGALPHEALLRQVAELVDVLVHPSREESQGMAVLEAMAAGVPVIGGERSGAIPWVLAGGEAGILTDIERPAVLADAMLRLAESAALRRSLGERGQASARARFHIRTVVNGYEACYRRLGAARGL